MPDTAPTPFNCPAGPACAGAAFPGHVAHEPITDGMEIVEKSGLFHVIGPDGHDHGRRATREQAEGLVAWVRKEGAPAPDSTIDTEREAEIAAAAAEYHQAAADMGPRLRTARTEDGERRGGHRHLSGG